MWTAVGFIVLKGLNPTPVHEIDSTSPSETAPEERNLYSMSDQIPHLLRYGEMDQTNVDPRHIFPTAEDWGRSLIVR